MSKKIFVVGSILLASLMLAGCQSEPVPDDQRVISKEERDNAFHAPDVKSLDDSLPAPTPAMGPGIDVAKPVENIPVVDKGTKITFPSSQEVSVSKNENLQIVVGMLVPNQSYKALIYYSGNGKDDKNIKLGDFASDQDGNLVANATIPANMVAGQYIMALENGDDIFTAPIKVG